jgi:hypothetical protein
MSSSKNIFVWFCGVLICQRGQIPRRTNPARYKTPQNKTLRSIRPRRTKSCGVSDPAEQWQICVHFIGYTCSAGSDTPINKVLRGIRPRGTKSCGGIKPRETTLKNKYFREFEKEFKNVLGCEFGDYMGSIREKTRGQKSRATVPLNNLFSAHLSSSGLCDPPTLFCLTNPPLFFSYIVRHDKYY